MILKKYTRATRLATLVLTGLALLPETALAQTIPSLKDTFRSWTLMETLVGLFGLLFVMLLSMFV